MLFNKYVVSCIETAIYNKYISKMPLIYIYGYCSWIILFSICFILML